MLKTSKLIKQKQLARGLKSQVKTLQH
jgi:hypothetical protein